MQVRCFLQPCFPLVCVGGVAASAKVKTYEHFEGDAVVPGCGDLIVSTYVYSEFADGVGGEIGLFRVPLGGGGHWIVGPAGPTYLPRHECMVSQ